ncbi:MAG TPA: glycosyltransferase [Pseudorhodoplanes sp.]|nr:glycosyltransferase [Pseudorhodoplanes sp.]
MPASLEDALLAWNGETDLDFVVPAFVTDRQDPVGTTTFRPVEIPLAIGPSRRPGDPALVSCLMVTRNRFELARLSIGCFRRQSWPRKELVVLDESADGRLRDWIASLGDPDIRVFQIATGSGSLGELRNRALELARGDFVCQWDDDDLQHPARLEVAFAAMAAMRVTTSLLAREMMWMAPEQRLCIKTVRPRPHENSLLTRREIAPRYPALARGEDTPAVKQLLGVQRAVLLLLPQLYIYVFHGRNTWDTAHAEEIWAASLERTEGAETEARLERFATAFPVREYVAALALLPVPAAPSSPAAARPGEASRRDSLLGYDGRTGADFNLRGFSTVAQPPNGHQLRAITLNLHLGMSRWQGPVPFVSCLMVTRDRFEFAQHAIECFRRQTWPNRELVVLDGGADDRLRDWITALGDPAIRWISTRGSQESLGVRRNRSIAAARGDYICVWDDDDLQHPARLEVAFAAMAATGTNVSLLSHVTMWQPWQRRVCVVGRHPRPQENTLLVLRSLAPRYPDLARGEDSPAVLQLLARHNSVMLTTPELYLYVVHGRNVSYGPVMEEAWQQSLDRSQGAEAESRLAAFAALLPVRSYAASLAKLAPPAAPTVPARPAAAPAKPAYRGVLLDYTGREDADFSIPGYLVRAQPPNEYRLNAVTLNLRLGPSRRRGSAPLVSCLMVTRDRFELARFSIASFQRQSWPQRELVVVDGSADDRLRDWIGGLDDPSIRWLSSRGSGETLGALRNRSIAEARGEVLCIWDDDDLHHPVRLEMSVAAMAAARASLCCLAHEMLWMIEDRKVAVLAQRPWPQEGTLVALRSAGLRYPSTARAEDTPAIRDLLLRHQGVLVNAPELYVYAIHGGNTWDRAHHDRLWASAADKSEGATAAARLMALGRTYPLDEYAAAVRERNARLRREAPHVAV